MGIKEIIALVISVCMTALCFPLIIKLANFCGECVCGLVKAIVTDYKAQWEECIKTIKGWFNGNI